MLASIRSFNRTNLKALGFYTLLTLAVTWPLALHLHDRVPGFFKADNYEYLWKMWWFKHAILDLRQTPLLAPDIFYPMGFQLAHAEITPLHTVLGLPLTAVLGEVVAYNIFALLSFVIAGWATFLLVKDLTGQPWAALLAGTLFMLIPYHTVRYGGILPQLSIEGIPIFFLGLERWARSRRWRWILLTGLGFLLAAWATFYYAAGLLLLGPLYLIVRLRSIPKGRQSWLQLGLLALLIALTLIPAGIPYWQLNQEISLKISLAEVDFWSASPTDYLAPPGLHPLWGTWVRQNLLSIPDEFNQIALEFVLGLGFVTILFAFYGIRHGLKKITLAFIVLAAAAAVLSFGPRLHFGRHPITIPAPEAAVESFHLVMNSLGNLLPSGETYQELEENGITIPLPALFLRWLLPPLLGMRAWNRFAIFFSLAITVLAGIGYAAWLRREVIPKATGNSRRVWISGIVVITLAVFELWPGRIPLQKIEARAVDAWLAEQPGQFTIMELPILSALSAQQMMYTRYHMKRTAFAYGTYFPIWYRQTFPELEECPGTQCLERLREWEVRYLLLNQDADDPSGRLRQELDRSTDLESVIELDSIRVYRLLPQP